MDSTADNFSFYDSLNKFKESLIQCPICLYYIKVNPKMDSMQFRSISDREIHFLTQHSFNDSMHNIIVSYVDYSYANIVNYIELSKINSQLNEFPLFHLVNLSEYQQFRERILELESNNNNLIASFKQKLEKLERLYDQKNEEIISRNSENIGLNVENSILISQKDLTAFTLQTLESENFFLKTENTRISSELNENEKTIDELLSQIINLEKTISENQKSISELKISSKELEKPDAKLLDLLEQEKTNKRIAIQEKKDIESENSELLSKIELLENKYAYEEELKNKAYSELQNLKDQNEHSLTLDYEKKISDMTLELKDKEEKISQLSSTFENKAKNNLANKEFRELTNNEFVSLQKKFNEIQYDILLSFYDIENIKDQLRNAIEQFFKILVEKANSCGVILLNDPEFTLFKDIRELNTRLKFTNDQIKAALTIQALNIVFTDLSKYIFAIIKAIKASFEGNSYTIIPDDAKILCNIEASRSNKKITFHVPFATEQLKNLTSQIRIFRPVSELYKNSFVFFTEEEIYLSNNNYKLLPFTFEATDRFINIQIDNFFLETDVFQLCSIDDRYFVIQKVNHNEELNFLRNIAEKNSLL